ncbi:FMN-binding protein [Eubacterium sp.]|uniref:FMN-binding protein n=1 Tax=Eubacterium sp. TaxID=142586 RepID=UPI002FC811D5
MGKKITLFLCLILLFLTGCTKEDIINNKKNGAVDTGLVAQYQDGSYTSISRAYDSYGYGQTLILEVHSGIITKVRFYEQNRTGTLKNDTANTWLSKSDTPTLAELYNTLVTKLIRAQSADIDTVSGATKTSQAFKDLATSAISNAQSGSTAVSKVDLDDTYTATSSAPSETGSIGTLTVIYDGHTISDVQYDEVKDGSNKSNNMVYKQLFTVMTRETLKRQELTPITPDPTFPEEYATYNALLENINSQRGAF